MKKTGLLLLSCLIAFAVNGQPVPGSLNEAEIRMQTLFSEITDRNTDEANRLINDTVAALLEKSLNLKGAFEYPFDSLKHVGKITSGDQKIRIFTWNLSFKDGTNEYFGTILHKHEKDMEIFSLTDSSATIKDPEWVTLDASRWYGCLIYDIIEKKAESTTYYTLLGYDPDNLFITRKLIDVLWFDNGMPAFGKPVFQYKKVMQSRLIFDYSAKVQMSLTWNKAMNMIVFDHLSPFNADFTGNYQYFGPDMTFDGLTFEKGSWVLREKIDVRN